MASIQNSEQFLTNFVDSIKKAKKRIYIQSMLFEYGKVLTELEPILIAKAKEGVDVRIHVDWVSQRYSEANHNIIPPLYGKKRKRMLAIHEQTRRSRERLIHGGVKIILTNKAKFLSKILSIFKRNHKKLYIVDDEAWLGGVNFFDLAFFEYFDIMVRFTDEGILKILAEEFFRVDKNKHKDNYYVSFNENTQLLVDAGISKSIIYDAAIMTIQQAKQSIVWVSQFVPDGKLLDTIIEKNVPTKIITSYRTHKYFTKLPYVIPYYNFLNKTKNKPNITLHHQKKFIHAKILIIDSKTAIFGSHNFVPLGVLLGTEEIAVKTTDTDLLKQLVNFVQTNTNHSTSGLED